MREGWVGWSKWVRVSKMREGWVGWSKWVRVSKMREGGLDGVNGLG